VVHDVRPGDEAEADCLGAADLAGRLGLPFMRADVLVRRGRGNMEARARAARYAALDRMAAEAGCPFVAVAHQRDDQAETVMMGLLRGAGCRGLAGVAESRGLRNAVLIRPMLEISRAQSRALCETAGWAWREDSTNGDERLTRGAVRHALLPVAERLRSGSAARMARTAALMHDAAGLIADRAESVWNEGRAGATGSMGWARGRLRTERGVVLGELVRLAGRRLRGGRGVDCLGSKSLDGVVRALRDGDLRPRRFTVGGLTIEVMSKEVRMTGACPDG
jgi:tRNA(Ile)-lysidine synthase